MPPFQPREVIRVLARHGVKYVVIGNLGGALHGSPLATTDIDLCPSREDANLQALAQALIEMEARIRTPDEANGIPFACDATFLRQMKMLNLTTRYGDVDLSFEPSGTGGYPDLAPRAVHIELQDGVPTDVAALEDIIRSKEAANREKDRLALPTLRRLLEEMRGRESSGGP